MEWRGKSKVRNFQLWYLYWFLHGLFRDMEIWDIGDLTNANYNGIIIENSDLNGEYRGGLIRIDAGQCG